MDVLWRRPAGILAARSPSHDSRKTSPASPSSDPTAGLSGSDSIDEDDVDPDLGGAPLLATAGNEFAARFAKLQRRARTEKARLTTLLQRQERRTNVERLADEPGRIADEARLENQVQRTIQRNCFTRVFYSLRGITVEEGLAGAWHFIRLRTLRERARAVWSHLRATVAALASLLETPPRHLVVSVVVDDTNMRLSDENGSSQVRTIMNVIQTVLSRDSDGRLHSFQLHTPSVVLATPTAGALHGALSAWVVCTGPPFSPTLPQVA